MILVFEKEGACPNCEKVKRYLSTHDVEYSLLTMEEPQLEFCKQVGITSAPLIVQVSSSPFDTEAYFHGGFSVDKLAAMTGRERSQ